MVTLLAGTNDLNNNTDVAGAPGRLDTMIKRLLTSAPDATVLVAGIPPTSNGGLDAKRRAFNASVQSLVSARAGSGQHIQYVDMDNLDARTDKADPLHPNASGYTVMGDDFAQAVQDALDKGWVAKPVPVKDNGGSGSGSGGLPVGVPNFQQGVQVTSAPQGPGSNQPGTTPLPGGAYVLMADMDGDGKADYVQVNPDNSLTVWLNREKNGKITWLPQGKIFDGVKGGRVQLADIHGNGKADYLLVAPDGDVTAYLNGGQDSSAPNGWRWEKQDTVLHPDFLRSVEKTFNLNVDHYQFADVDGDDHADFVIIDKNSSALVVSNDNRIIKGGPLEFTPRSLNKDIKEGTSVIKLADRISAPGIGVAGSMISFADVDGDGQADYVVTDPKTGAVSAYLANTKSKEIQTKNNLDSFLIFTWKGVEQIAWGVGPGAQVRLADLDGDGAADYAFVTGKPKAGQWFHNGGADPDKPGKWILDPRGYLASAGDRTVFADMNGDGKADIVRIGANSSLTAQLSTGGGLKPTVGQSAQVAPGIGVPGEQIQLADIDGDKKADYLNVDPKTGAVTAFFNQGPGGAGGNYKFSAPVKIAGGVAPGAQIRFADMRNIGRADYVVVNPTTGGLDDYENCGYDKATQHQCWFIHPKIAGGLAPGDQVRLAPAFGTGRADYLIVHPNGSVDAWVNGGPNNATGGGWLWIQQKKPIAGGVGAPGEQIQFADLNGNKFADYLIVHPDGSVEAWANAGLIPA